MTISHSLSDDAGTRLIADTLRLFVGQGKRISWADLAAATGDNERKLRSYVEAGDHRMPAPVMMRIFAVLPPEAWARVNRAMGFQAPAPLELDDCASVRRAMTEASLLVSRGCEALEDGELDHRERTEIGRAAEKLIPVLATLAGGLTITRT